LQTEGSSIEAELPIVLVAPQGDVVRRAKNGQLIVDTPSTINNREWWSPKWFKVPVVGPSRDLELEYGGVSTLRLMAASVRGTRHQFYGEPNQDAFAVGKNDKYVVIVVCDGVGSAAHSAYGSKYISFSVARSLAKSLETVVQGDLDAIRSCITTAVQKASDGVQTWSDGALFAPDLPSSEVSLDELYSTLMVGVIEIEASTPEGRRVVLANVGDSPCYTFVDESWTLRTAATKEGDVLEHKTDALPNEIGVPVILEWHDFVMNPREQLLLMTDGIGTSLASGQTPLGRWLGSRLSTPILAKDFLTAAQIEEWVDTATFDRQGEDDDRTLVVLYDFDHAFSEKPLAPEQEINSVEEVDSSSTETSDESKSELLVEETPQTVVTPPVAPPPTVEA
jgi:serine/threonine protein phosphatase PrpC